MRLPRVTHQIMITEYEDGSHDINYDFYDAQSFVGFASYLMSAGFAEHWIDKLPDYLVHELHNHKHEEGCPNGACNHDEPVIQPTEVFSESSEDDE